MDATKKEENQPPKKKKNKKRISFIGRRMPLPAYRDMKVEDLYKLVSPRTRRAYEQILKNINKGDFRSDRFSENFKDIVESMQNYNYDPEEFGYIKIQEYPTELRVTDGNKRLVFLNSIIPTKKIRILHLEDFVRRIPNPDMKRKNLKDILRGFENNNTETSK